MAISQFYRPEFFNAESYVGICWKNPFKRQGQNKTQRLAQTKNINFYSPQNDDEKVNENEKMNLTCSYNKAWDTLET